MRLVVDERRQIQGLPTRQPPPSPRRTLSGVKAALLIPGRGNPIEHGAVIIDGPKIAWVGSQSDIPSKFRDVAFATVPVVMPGLLEQHALAGARSVRDVANTLLAGFTTVREVAGYGGEISPAIDDGTIIGPNIYSSVAALSMTAGHADLHEYPITTVLHACANGMTMAICDGVPDCIKTVRLMIRRGARLIKICATGGVGSLLDDPEDRQFSDAELEAIVEEAARAKRIVAAHCHGKEGIIAALNAGCKTIEHGSYLDEEVISLMKKKDAILVATRLIIEAGLAEKHLWSPVSYAKLVVIAKQHKKAYALAVKGGVKIALGTDQTISDPGSLMSHGRNGKELTLAVEAGMTPLQAIEACTAAAPETLGPQAPLSGMLKEGYNADLIAVSGNPLEDIGVLSEAKNVTHVWKGGKLFKSPASER